MNGLQRYGYSLFSTANHRTPVQNPPCNSFLHPCKKFGLFLIVWLLYLSMYKVPSTNVCLASLHLMGRCRGMAT